MIWRECPVQFYQIVWRQWSRSMKRISVLVTSELVLSNGIWTIDVRKLRQSNVSDQLFLLPLVKNFDELADFQFHALVVYSAYAVTLMGRFFFEETDTAQKFPEKKSQLPEIPEESGLPKS